MKRNKLSIRMGEGDVAVLHNALVKLGFQISPDEIENKCIGEDTRNAIREFQKKHRLRSSGEVDKITAAKIKKIGK
jgi:N-acetyl-anhydromuramyl-L-alanine amidase AmpD